MAVRIRLKKLGRSHRPYYRICVMDARTPRDGKTIEEIGTYDPMIRDTDKRVTIDAERVDYWLGVGALPTEKVKILIDKYKGKVPAVRQDRPAERAVPQDLPPLEARRPKPRSAAPVVQEPALAAEAEDAAKTDEPAPAEPEPQKAPSEEAAPAAE